MKRLLLACAVALGLALPVTAEAHVPIVTATCTQADIEAINWPEGGQFGIRVLINGSVVYNQVLNISTDPDGVIGPITIDYPDITTASRVEVFTSITTPSFVRPDQRDFNQVLECVPPPVPVTPAPGPTITPTPTVTPKPKPRPTPKKHRITRRQWTCTPTSIWDAKPRVKFLRTRRGADGRWYPYTDLLVFRDGKLVSRRFGRFCGPIIVRVTG